MIDKKGQPHNSALSSAPGQQLESWKEIAAYLKKDVRTVQRWEKQEDLPVYRHVHSKLGTVYAYRAELDAWWRNGHQRLEALASKERRKVSKAYSGLALAGAVLAGAVMIAFNPAGIRGRVLNTFRPPSRSPLRTVVVDSLRGAVVPSFSPDGKRMVFSWALNGLQPFDLYLKRIGSDQPQRLTRHPTDFPILVSWSPNGRYIAFVRQDESSTALYIIPPEGGEERRLANFAWHPGELEGGISWTPDSKSIAYRDRIGDETYGIFLISTVTLERRAITTPPPGNNDFDPSISPDGELLSFLRGSSTFGSTIFVVPVLGGTPQPLKVWPSQGFGHTWTRDNRGILFAGNVDGVRGLWRVALDSDQPELLVANTKAAGFSSPTLLNDGRQLAFVAAFPQENIWQADLTRRSKPRMLISSSGDEFPQFSPNGRRLVFQSKRTGLWEIWTSDNEGSNTAQLTHLNGTASFPRWSPDGKQIAFDARDAHGSQIYIIDSGGGIPRRLETGGGRDETPFWSRDGQWIYFASNRVGIWQVRKIRPRGGESVQLTRGGGYAPQEAADGNLYFVRSPESGGIWKLERSGEEHPVLEVLPPGYWANWMVTSDGIYFVNPVAVSGPKIEFWSFSRREIAPLVNLTKYPVIGVQGLAVSPDQRRLLFPQGDQVRCDINLIENFD